MLEKRYTISEFLQKDASPQYTFEDFLQDIDRYKQECHVLVIVLAIVLQINTVYAASFETSLNQSANQIIDLLLILARYSFLGMGLKEIIAVVIAGGSFKDATSAGIQYLLTYVLIKLYPSLFGMFSDLKF